MRGKNNFPGNILEARFSIYATEEEALSERPYALAGKTSSGAAI